MRHARPLSKFLLFPDWTMAMHYYIISPYLWQTFYSECRTVLHVWWHAVEKREHITLWGYQKAIQQCTERNPSEHQLSGCGTSCQTTFNSQQIKTNFVRFLKPIDLIWRIYKFKLVYYVWNVFDLYELRICFN